MNEGEPPPPETLSFEPFIAVQSRMLLAASDLANNIDVINPANKKVNPFTKEQLTDFNKHDYSLFDNASTNERRREAEVSRDQLDQKVQAWAETCANLVRTDERGKIIFGDKYQKITTDNMVKFYNIYFTGDDKKSNLKLFVQDTLTRYTVNEQINVLALEQDLSVIEWFAHVFGGNSAEIVTQLIDAEIKFQTNQDQFVQEGNQNVNVFAEGSDDERLLKFLWANRPTVQLKVGPTTTTEPTTKEGDQDFEITILKPESTQEIIKITEKEIDKPTVIQVKPDQIPTQDQVEFRLIPYLEKLGLKTQFENWLPLTENGEYLPPIKLPGISTDGTEYYYQAIRKQNQYKTTQYSCLLFKKKGPNDLQLVGHVDFSKLADSNEANCSTNQLRNILKERIPPELPSSLENLPRSIEAVKVDNAFRGQGLGKVIWYLALSQAQLEDITKVNIHGDLTRDQRPDRPGESFYENLGADAILLFQEINGDMTSAPKFS